MTAIRASDMQIVVSEKKHYENWKRTPEELLAACMKEEGFELMRQWLARRDLCD